MLENILRVDPKEAISPARLRHFFHALIGSLLIAVYSQLEIPIQPVPITLQTLALFILAFTQGGRLAMHSVLFYLIEATLGLPVLAGGKMNPYWFASPSAGYLFSFLLAAFVIGKLEEKNVEQKVFPSYLNLLLGQMLIWGLGSCWLACFIGPIKAIKFGILPFIPGTAVKMILAIVAKKPFKKVFTQNGNTSI